MEYLNLLKYGIERQASDVHLVPNAKAMIRRHGKLELVEEFEIFSYKEIQEISEAICSEDQLRRLQRKGELNFSLSIRDLGRFRVNILLQRGTQSITFRLLQMNIPNFDELGLPETFVELISKRKGLLIVSGASGSGKSTSIAALIKALTEGSKSHVVTVEEPIEYLFSHGNSIVSQRDVGTDCVSIYEGVLSSMRHDPDVLMISSLSDENVIDLAFQAAESGKLVIAGVAANSSRTTIETLINASTAEKREIKKHKLTSTLLGIISQQLIPNNSDDGLILAYELLLPNAAIKSYIYNDQLKDIYHALIAGRKNGMSYMDNYLFELYKAGKISRASVYKYAYDVDFVKRLEVAYNKE